jgi:hypothetical protein
MKDFFSPILSISYSVEMNFRLKPSCSNGLVVSLLRALVFDSQSLERCNAVNVDRFDVEGVSDKSELAIEAIVVKHEVF